MNDLFCVTVNSTPNWYEVNGSYYKKIEGSLTLARIVGELLTKELGQEIDIIGFNQVRIKVGCFSNVRMAVPSLSIGNGEFPTKGDLEDWIKAVAYLVKHSEIEVDRVSLTTEETDTLICD